MIVCVQCGTKIMEQRTSCPSCGTFLPEMQSNPGTEAKAGAIAHGEQRAKTFPFDSLFEEYLPQPAPIYDRIYTPTMPRKAPAREQEKAPRVAPVAHSSDVPTRHT